MKLTPEHYEQIAQEVTARLDALRDSISRFGAEKLLADLGVSLDGADPEDLRGMADRAWKSGREDAAVLLSVMDEMDAFGDAADDA